jgi:hypothetical protein
MLGITRVPVDAPIEDGDIRIIITKGAVKAVKQGAFAGLILGAAASFTLNRLRNRGGAVQAVAETAEEATKGVSS